MKKEFKVWAMTCIAFWCLAPNISKSQDSLHHRELNEVVITATKFPKSHAETGKVLTIIDSLMLQRSGGKDLSQILGEQAGIYVNGANSNPGKDKAVYLRGAATHHTLFLIDGIPISDPSGVNGGMDLRLIPIGMIERIEILKGSQSTLYGSDAMAGVINIITKKDLKDPFFLNLLGAYGTYNSLDTRISGGGTIASWLSVSGGFSHASSDGISEARDTLGTENFDKDDFSNTAAHLSLLIKPVSGMLIEPFFKYSTFDGGYDAGAFTDDPTAEYSGTFRHTGVRGEYESGKNSWYLLAAHTLNDRTFSSEFGEFNAIGNATHTEFFWKRKLAEHWQLLSGVSYQHMDLDGEDIPSATIFSPYFSLFYTSTNFSMEGGIRYNHHSEYGSNITYSLNPSWRTGRWKIFANVGTGFKVPTLNQLFGQFGPNPELDPERSEHFEVGGQYVAEAFDIRITAFQRTIEDMIIYTARYENVDRQEVKGLEVEPTWHITKNLDLTGFYALMDGEVTTQTSEGDSTYTDLIRKPRHAFGLTLGASVWNRVRATAAYRRYGARDDRFFDLNSFTTQTVALDGYDLLDIYVDYSLNKDKITLFLNLQNALDQGYEEVYGYNVQERTVSIGGRIAL